LSSKNGVLTGGICFLGSCEKRLGNKDRKTRKAKAKMCLFVRVSRIIFTIIMTFKSAKEIWDCLNEISGNQRTQNMLVLNLVREFELQRMKNFETIKKY